MIGKLFSFIMTVSDNTHYWWCIENWMSLAGKFWCNHYVQSWFYTVKTTICLLLTYIFNSIKCTSKESCETQLSHFFVQKHAVIILWIYLKNGKRWLICLIFGLINFIWSVYIENKTLFYFFIKIWRHFSLPFIFLNVFSSLAEISAIYFFNVFIN